jgi:hypothetical protein
MTNFIYNNSGVPIDKINLGPLPPGANPRQWAVATEWITICQALLDIQAFCRGAAWVGFTLNAADPAPSGIANYLWMKSDGTLWKTIGGVPTQVSGGGGTSGYALVFQPGGAQTGPVIFNTWAGLMAQLTTLRAASNGGGRYEIEFDDTFTTPIVIPAGTYNMRDVLWTSSQYVAVHVATGVVLQKLRRVNNVALTNLGTTPCSDFVDQEKFEIRGTSGITNNVGSTPPFFVVSGAVTVSFWLYDQAELSGSGDLTGPVLRMTTGATVLFELIGGLIVNRALGDDGTGTYNVNIFNSGSQFWEENPNFSGTAAYLNYTSVRWFASTQVYTALDSPTGDSPDTVVRLDFSGGPITVQLPFQLAGSGMAVRGQTQVIKSVSAYPGTLTIVPNAGETIEGATSLVLTVQPRQAYLLAADGLGSWNIVSAYNPITAMAGETPGLGVGESVILSPPLLLLAGGSYTLVVTAIAHGISPGPAIQSFKQMYSVRVSNLGVATIAGTGMLEQTGDAAAASWSLTGSVDGTPNFRLTFNDGTSNTFTRVKATVAVDEVFVPPM